MSPSLKAWPETRFSAQQRMSFTRLSRPRLMASARAPVTMAAPPMSDFIGSMLSEDFME
ncbi:hypothetical protein D3C72_2536260 [compost metagenome]